MRLGCTLEGSAGAGVVAVKVHAVFFATALASGLLWWRGSEERETTKPSVVETKVAHRFGSKASLALEGRMVPSHERGFQ